MLVLGVLLICFDSAVNLEILVLSDFDVIDRFLHYSVSGVVGLFYFV